MKPEICYGFRFWHFDILIFYRCYFMFYVISDFNIILTIINSISTLFVLLPKNISNYTHSQYASSPDFLWENFITYCLEIDEYLNFGGTFQVGGISTIADRGGKNTNSGDVLSPFTAYLYTQAVNGTYADDQLADVQFAIWHEEEIDMLSGDNLIFYDQQKNNFAASGWTGLENIRVINLTDANGNYRQDLLVTAPVPEPATVLLLGTGLIGLAGFGRKKSFKKKCSLYPNLSR